MGNSSYLFGAKAITDAAANHVPIRAIYRGGNVKFPLPLQNLVEQLAIPVVEKDKRFFQRFGSVNHQFLVGEIGAITPISLAQALRILDETPSGIALILDSVEDVRNFGSILRSAAAYACPVVFFRQHHQAPINEVVIRMSMGAASYLNLCAVNNLSNLTDKLKTMGYWVYATVLDHRAKSLYAEEFPKRVALVMGSEGKGIRDHLVGHADQTIYIPMLGKVQSLNVGVACGICLSYISEKIRTDGLK